MQSLIHCSDSVLSTLEHVPCTFRGATLHPAELEVRPHPTRRPARNRTGMVRGPEMKLLASHSGGAVRSTSSIRESTSTSMASISIRAMCWPRHTCGPLPKAMCSFCARARSSAAG